MAASGARVDPAAGLVVLIFGEYAGILDGRVASDVTRFEAGEPGYHLESGTRVVDAVDGAVEQRGGGIVQQFRVAVEEGGDIEGGIGGHRQDAAVPHIRHDHGATGGHVARSTALVDLLDLGGERVLGRFLQADVQREIDVAAVHGFFQDLRIHHGACIFRIEDAHAAVASVEILLKRLLHAVFADVRVHGIALILVDLVFLRVHLSDIAQDVSGAVRSIHAACCRFHGNAGIIAFLEDGDEIGGDVARKHVVLHRVDHAGLHLVAEADDRAGVSGGNGVIDAVMVPKPDDEVRGGDVRIQIKIVEIGSEHVLLGRGRLGDPRERGSGGHGEGIGVIHTGLLGGGRQLEKDIVGVLLFQERRAGQRYVVRRPAAYEQGAVPVQNIAPGRSDRLRQGVRADPVVGSAGLRQLQLVHFQKEHKDDDGQKKKQSGESSGPEHSFHRVRSFLRMGKGKSGRGSCPAVRP